jgi:uncharacterized membrane protein
MQAPVESKKELTEGTTPQNTGKAPFFNVGEGERYGSILGGAALAVAGLSRRGWGGLAMGLVGGMLIQRGVSGHCNMYERFGISGAKSDRPGVPDNVGITVERHVVINRPPGEVYGFWREFGNLGSVMQHVDQVKTDDGLHTHWIVRTPWGRRMEWDAVVINEHPGEMIAWESLPGAQVQNAGAVRFEPEGNGTKVTVKLEYNPPWGLLGRVAVFLFGEEPGRAISDDLQRLKKRLETGE